MADHQQDRDYAYDVPSLLRAIDAACPQQGGDRVHALRSRADAAALAVHAALALAGFRLVALATPQVHDANSTDVNLGHPVEGAVGARAALPSDWNAPMRGGGALALRYRHDESSLTYLLKLLPLGGKLLVHGVAAEDDSKVASAEIDLGAVALPESSFPARVGGTSGRAARSALKFDDADAMQRGVLDVVRESVILKLAPSLGKEGFQRMSSAAGTQTEGGAGPAARPGPAPRHPPFPMPAGGGVPAPGPFQGGERPMYPFPHPSPFSIGHRDLDPLGGAPPMGGFPFGGGRPLGGMTPYGDFGGDGGGSIMGPGHPMLGPHGGGGGGITGPDGRVWGGDGFLPPGAIPPGARFDPIGPQVPPGGGPHGVRPPLGRGGRGRGGPTSGVFSGEPDNDEFPPPGYNDMFS